MVFDLVIGDGKLLQPDKVHVKPFAVGTAGGIVFLALLIRDQLLFYGIDKQHPAGLKSALLHDFLSRNVEDSDLRGQDEHIVVGYVIS